MILDKKIYLFYNYCVCVYYVCTYATVPVAKKSAKTEKRNAKK